MNFILPKKLNVVSDNAPVIADDGEHRRGDEDGVVDDPAARQRQLADQGTDPDPDGEQVEHRLEEAGDHHSQ